MNKILLIDKWPFFDNRPHKHKIIAELSKNNELLMIFYNNSLYDIFRKISLTLLNFFNNRNFKYSNNFSEKINNSPILFYIHKKKIEYLYSNNLFDLKTKKRIVDFNPDYIVPLSSPILPIDFLKLAKEKAINYHVSLLPSFRGINALEWSLLYNSQVGVTLYQIDEGVDTGPILNYKIIKINDKYTINSLKDKLLMEGANMVCDFFNSSTKVVADKFESHYIEKKQFYKMSSDLLMVTNRQLK